MPLLGHYSQTSIEFVTINILAGVHYLKEDHGNLS